jgi:hypothetical protein
MEYVLSHFSQDVDAHRRFFEADIATPVFR